VKIPVASPDPRGAEVRGSGGRSPIIYGQSQLFTLHSIGSRGRAAVGVWGQSPQKLTLVYTIYSCEKSLFSLQFTEFEKPRKSFACLMSGSLRQTDSVAGF